MYSFVTAFHLLLLLFFSFLFLFVFLLVSFIVLHRPNRQAHDIHQSHICRFGAIVGVCRLVESSHMNSIQLNRIEAAVLLFIFIHFTIIPTYFMRARVVCMVESKI